MTATVTARARRCILLVIICCSAALSGAASAQDIQAEITAVEHDLIGTLRDPVQLSALRSLVAVQIEYRIAIKLVGYEQTTSFARIWTNFNALMYGGGPAAIRARLEVGEKTNKVFRDAVRTAYAANADLYGRFQDRLIDDVYGVGQDRAELKRRLRRAMLAYAIMNWLNEPSLGQDWYLESWVFPACPVLER
ncbi:MAG TPA: hypothetical protein VG742_01835 [Dongiaceae bacterium]|nr:hypothetical protein [Dongiaceae bacterium]